MTGESDPGLPRHEIQSMDVKQCLLDGSLDPAAFCSELMRRDQSTPEREASSDNISILMSPEVYAFFSNVPEHRFQYQNLLSLSFFHRGQSEAVANNYPAALDSFRLAADAAKPIEEERYQYWKDYIAGTIAYLEKDIEALRHICETTGEGKHREILTSFLNQLEGGWELTTGQPTRRNNCAERTADSAGRQMVN